MITSCVKTGPHGGKNGATVCSGIGGSMFLVLPGVRVTTFWVFDRKA